MTRTSLPHYPSFGSCIQELQYAYADAGDTSKYRFGFNNQEQDKELGEYYTFEYRMHDARLGRFLSVDPLSDEYPWYTPYQIAGNTPLWASELEVLEPEIKSSIAGSDPNIVQYTLTNGQELELDASKGDRLTMDNLKVTGYKKNGVEINWSSQFGYFWNGELTSFEGGTIKAKRPKTFAQWEAEFSSTDGMPYKVLSTVFEFSPQACGWNASTGVIYGEDMYGNEQSSIQTAGNIVGLVLALPGKPFAAVSSKIASKSASTLGKLVKPTTSFGPRTLSSAAKFNKVLQSGGQALTNSTLKALKLTKSQGRDAIHALKKDFNLPNDFHGKILSNGDYLDPKSNEFIANFFDYIY
jgi:RHS repeat-associated protein